MEQKYIIESWKYKWKYASLYLFKILVFLSKNQYKSIPLFLQVKVGDSSDSMLHQERQELLENQQVS